MQWKSLSGVLVWLWHQLDGRAVMFIFSHNCFFFFWRGRTRLEGPDCKCSRTLISLSADNLVKLHLHHKRCIVITMQGTGKTLFVLQASYRNLFCRTFNREITVCSICIIADHGPKHIRFFHWFPSSKAECVHMFRTPEMCDLAAGQQLV